jgi:hypothetical protein
MNAFDEPFGGFEERLLAELRRVVAERPGPAAAQSTSRSAAAGLWRRRPLALAGGLAAAAAAAALAGVALNGGDGTAWAVERNADGTVTVRIDSLSDADGLERMLAAEGVPALVQYLPAGKACAGAPGTGAPLPPPAEGNGRVTEERGLNEAPAGGSDYSLDRAGTPPAGEPHGAAVETLVRTEEDGGVEFTIDSARSPGETLVITSQTLPAGPGATVDGTALSIEYVKGEARPCAVVDTPR